MSTLQQQQVMAVPAMPALNRLRQVWPWLAAIVVALALPHALSSGHAINMLNQMAVMIVFALSYNMLLGNTGLLSFGHAVYFGLGAYCAMHVLRAMNEAGLGLPIELLPLVGAVAGLAFGIVLGAVSTRRAGVVFAMISLGIGELVSASSLMFTGFFGGEAGLFGNRVQAESLFGIDYGPGRNIYYLVVSWTLLAAVAMYLLRKTPLGWMANAVRDNPERAQFVGYNPQMVRFLQFCLAAFFAGLAGGLFVLTEEIVTAETVSAIHSGKVLLSAYIGGIGFFLGPVLGAILVVYLETTLSVVSQAWMLYFGLVFMAVVMFAPRGLVGTASDTWTAIRGGQWRGNAWQRLYAVVTLLLAVVGAICLLELAFHYRHSWDPSEPMTLFLFTVDATTLLPWLISALLFCTGLTVFFRHARPRLRQALNQTGGGKS